jgi:hypothetical protein
MCVILRRWQSRPSLFWDDTKRICLPTFRDSQLAPLSCAFDSFTFDIGLMICPRTSINNYRPALCNIAEQWKPQLHHGRRLNSRRRQSLKLYNFGERCKQERISFGKAWKYSKKTPVRVPHFPPVRPQGLPSHRTGTSLLTDQTSELCYSHPNLPAAFISKHWP